MSITPFERFEVIRQVTNRLRFQSEIDSAVQTHFCAFETLHPDLLRAMAGLRDLGVLHIEKPRLFFGGRIPASLRLSDGLPSIRQEFRELNRLMQRFCSETHCYRIGKASGKLILTGRLGPDSWCVLMTEFKVPIDRL